jgi:PKD repeat protein
MKKLITLAFVLGTLFPGLVCAQSQILSDSANGDWSAQHTILLNTPEADFMVRAGDIDNLGFGWPTGFDPFSGYSTPGHGYPWAIDTSNAMGTDRIMVITSYNGSPPYGQDGYTNSTSRPANLPRPIVLDYNLEGLQVNNAALQVFVDDFQAPVWHANYFVTLNGKDAAYFAEVINSLSQTGPVGKMVTINIPEEDLYLLQSDSLSILFDDTITGAGDGFAIDFVKLLINTSGFSYTGNVYGYVFDIVTGKPIKDAIVSASSIKAVLTDSTGYYNLTGLPAGINKLMVTKFSYDTTSVMVDIQSGQSIQRSFEIREILDAEFGADHTLGVAPFTVHFTDMTSLNPDTWLWDFGDGTTSVLQNPSHTYQTKGLYTVTLKASNSVGSSTEKKTGFINVGAVGVDEIENLSELSIAPNPTVSGSVLSYKLIERTMINIGIYSQYGQKVRNIFEGLQAPGKHSYLLDTKSLSPGIYYVVIRMNGQSLSRKIIVMR